MITSLRWLSSLLDSPADGASVEQALIHAGFPIESREVTPNGDTRLDVEITSNRGDCLSHVGLAREAAAGLGCGLRTPALPTLSTTGEHVRNVVSLENRNPDLCPRFTLRVIRGVKIGPSPSWLRDALESIGQRSINNVVDVTNYIGVELGNPSHVFDLAKLEGRSLIVRFATDGEKLKTLDGKQRTLKSDELVVADARRPQSLAGVMGGHDSEVSADTTDVVLEMATWDPVTIRRAARRHQLRTDASHRFERIVDPRSIDLAAARCAALILEVAGGRLCEGMLDEGRPPQPPTHIVFRPSRCRALLGAELTVDEMVNALRRLDIAVEPIGRAGESLRCTPPVVRPDLTREADLIEEVARAVGYAKVPVHPKLPVTVSPPQASEAARRELGTILTGLGFYETVTFSFTDPRTARAFCPADLSVIEIDDDRRGEEPALRPSVLAGLMACRRKNQHGLVHAAGGIRLHEVAAVFAEQGKGGTVENINVGLLLDCPVAGKAATTGELQHGVRLMRGAIESLVRGLSGPEAVLGVESCGPVSSAFDAAAFARLTLNGAPLGVLGLISRESQRAFDLATPVVGAELNLAALIAGYPPRCFVHTLPAFPGIERDLSLVVGERTAWTTIEQLVRSRTPAPFEDVAFVGTYRGQQVGKGRKSVTLRVSFRDPSRTLRHEEIDGPVGSLVQVLKHELGAELRA